MSFLGATVDLPHSWTTEPPVELIFLPFKKVLSAFISYFSGEDPSESGQFRGVPEAILSVVTLLS